MKTKPFVNILTAVVLAMVSLISTGALAATVTYVTHLTSARSAIDTDSDMVLQQIGTSAGYAAAASYASATTAVTVGQGWARAAAVASAEQEDSSASGSVQGMWVDDLTFSGPGLTGAGVATVLFDVSGSLSAASNSPTPGSGAGADWNLYFQSGTIIQSFVGSGALNAAGGVPTIITGDLNGGVYSVDFDFFYDVPIQIKVALNVSADANHSGSASGEFGNTLEWGGITELRDNTGALVDSYNLVSGSGVDWRQAVSAPAVVPLPAGIWLLFSGLFSLAPALRRRYGPRSDTDH